MKKIRWAQNKDVLRNLGSYPLELFPDEILVIILSSLPIKDAVASSLLSRRWRYLWCQIDRLLFVDEGRWNLSCIDHIVHQHKNPTIDKLKICFDLDKYAKGAMSKLIKFAISKNVQMLELNFVRNNGTGENNCFPGQIFDIEWGSWLDFVRNNGIGENNDKISARESWSSLNRKFLNVPIMKIKSLILNHVDVNDYGLTRILSNCPVLEHLSIVDSRKLVKPEIHGKDLALKTLVMRSCNVLESIEILDSNIVYFDFQGSPISTLRLDNLQKLEKICISKGCSLKKFNHVMSQISCSVPYLQVLELDLHGFPVSILLHPFSKLQKLKQLIVGVVELDDEDDLLQLTPLVEAFPNLQRLRIRKVCWFGPWKTSREVRKIAKKPHQCLEVVEIDDYHCEINNFELAMYFIQNCVALKKLVIKPFMELGFATNEIASKNRYNARRQLEPRTPAGVELVIL